MGSKNKNLQSVSLMWGREEKMYLLYFLTKNTIFHHIIGCGGKIIKKYEDIVTKNLKFSFTCVFKICL